MIEAKDHSSAPTRRVQPAGRRLPYPLSLYQTAVGKKYVMAITGISLMGFVLVHMIGNLKAYLGPEDLNHYGEWLRSLLEPALPRTVALWLMRVGLITFFFLHIHSAYGLTRMNQRARTADYSGGRDYVAANFASRTMRWTGIIVGLYVIFHLMDLTWGNANPDFVRGNPYNNLAHSLDRIPVAIVYLAANVALAIHLFHGAWSLFQSMGWNNPRFNRARRHFAMAFSALILVGNVSFPIMVQAGVIEAADHTSPGTATERGAK